MDIRIPAKAKKDIPLDGDTITKGTEIDITKGKDCEYAIWHHTGIYDLPVEYIDLIDTKQ